MAYRKQQVAEAVEHLRTADPVMSEVIDRVGPFTLKAQRDRFGMLVRSIISQQISTKAARSIRNRLIESLATEALSPETIAARSTEDLRAVGLSGQKASYLQELCAHVNDGRLVLNTIGRKTDADVIADLTAVKGIGVWTAQMFLIFSLGRMDVFPEDDLGIRSAIAKLYGLKNLPDRATGRKIAEPWRPYATVASWYCWRSLDGLAQV